MNLRQTIRKTVQLFAALRRTGFWVLSGLGVLFTTPAWATERVVLGGNTDKQPLSRVASSQQTQTIVGLYDKAAKSGSVRLIVGLRVPFAPEGQLTVDSANKQRSEIAQAHGKVISRIPTLAQDQKRTKQFETIPFMGLEVTDLELDALITDPNVISIEEDKLASPSLSYSVPLIGASAGTFSGYSGLGQTVAILDTGVESAHQFLTGKVVSEACYSTTSGASSTSVCPGGINGTATGAGAPCGSDCSHGTHVAGITAGRGVSFSGVAKDASLIAVQVFSRFGSVDCGGASTCVLSYTSDQILGLQRVYALRSSYSIASVNMSLGGGSYASACDGTNGSIKTAIDNLRSVGIATVIASGNNGYTSSISAPACVSTAISVGATYARVGLSNASGACSLGPTVADQIACFSNSSSQLNLLAPGGAINSSVPGGTTYSIYSGTSMATPHVAGAWAVLKQKAPAATVTEVLAALSSSGVAVLDPRNGITKPRISLPAALIALTPGATHAVTVSKAGAGTGSVTSAPAGIDCGATCSASFPIGISLTLTATPAGSSVFTGWSGACSGTGTCTVAVNSALNVTATFGAGSIVTPINQVNLSGAAGTAQYFAVVVPAGAANLVIQTSGGTGDVDLYVKASAQPTTSVWDCRPYVNGNDEICSFPSPLATTYYIMLNAYSTYSGVSLTASYTSATPTYPGALSFSSSSLTVMENAGNATVTVSRTGGSDGAASVLYGTSAGTATAGVDYTTTVGNLTWASGDASSRTISVPIINNAVVNSSARSFTINLSGVSGSTLGSPGAVTISITDDDGKLKRIIPEIIYMLLMSD